MGKILKIENSILYIGINETKQIIRVPLSCANYHPVSGDIVDVFQNDEIIIVSLVKEFGKNSDKTDSNYGKKEKNEKFKFMFAKIKNRLFSFISKFKSLPKKSRYIIIFISIILTTCLYMGYEFIKLNNNYDNNDLEAAKDNIVFNLLLDKEKKEIINSLSPASSLLKEIDNEAYIDEELYLKTNLDIVKICIANYNKTKDDAYKKKWDYFLSSAMNNFLDSTIDVDDVASYLSDESNFDGSQINAVYYADVDETKYIEKPEIGMTKNEVIETDWGEPEYTETSAYYFPITEYWYYKWDRCICFENGIVFSIDK
ncbi:MAG: hypothetical protein RSD36_18385 [Terrisporobacter sp.]